MRDHTFGQIIPLAQIGIAAGDVALDYSNFTQLQDMQASFQKKLDSDAAMIEYIKYIVDRFTSAGVRLAKSGRYQPGTPAFETVLALLLKNDMQYLGNCDVRIYTPASSSGARTVWAIISRQGFITPPTNIPPDVGSIWASGCKDAQDQFSIEYIKAIKGTQRFNVEALSQMDIGTINLFLRIGLGVFLIVMVILIIKTQSELIGEQATVRYVRKVKAPSVVKK